MHVKMDALYSFIPFLEQNFIFSYLVFSANVPKPAAVELHKV